VPQAIVNLKNTGTSALVGPKAAPEDVYAQNNTFGTLSADPALVPIERLVYHDYDSANRSFVNYVTPATIQPVVVIDTYGFALFYSVNPTPGANNAWAQRSMIRRMRISFSDFVFVDMSDPNPLNRAVVVSRDGTTFNATGGTHTGPVTASLFNTFFDPTSTTGRYFNYEFGFSGPGVEVSGSLVDGKYNVTVNNTKIQAYVPFSYGSFPGLQPAAPLNTSFHRLFGDVDGDGKVSSSIPSVTLNDLTAFNAAYRSRRGMTNYVEYLDFDNDGDNDGADQTQFYRRLNRY
jgi:hypothetical protein